MAQTSKKILILGSGSVAPPCIDYLTRNSNNQVTVDESGPDLKPAENKLISCSMSNAGRGWKASATLPRTMAIALDVASTSDLDQHMPNYDVVISLVPYTYHAAVIKSAIRHKTQVVTTSYVSEAIKALDSAAKEAGLTILNEVGVDPGVDHLVSLFASAPRSVKFEFNWPSWKPFSTLSKKLTRCMQKGAKSKSFIPLVEVFQPQNAQTIP